MMHDEDVYFMELRYLALLSELSCIFYLFVINHYRYLKIYTLNLLVVMHYCCCWWWWEHLVLNAGRKMTKVLEQNAVPSHDHYVAAPVVNNLIDVIPDER